jgi:hypothetical protein
VHERVNGSVGEKFIDFASRRFGIDEIKHDRVGSAAVLADRFDDRLRATGRRVRMHMDVPSIRSETARDRAADIAAAAGDEYATGRIHRASSDRKMLAMAGIAKCAQIFIDSAASARGPSESVALA